MPVSPRPTDATTSPAPARHGVAERLMLADVSGELFGDGHELVATVGRFVLLDELGSGGMGRVYRAYDPELDRNLALKVLRGDAADTESATMRLRAEAIALARLNHPNVVSIHEVHLVGDELVLAMELVEGQDLGRWAKEVPPPEPFAEDDRFRTAIGYLRQAATGLAAAHAAGLVHRDFKPSNVLVGNDGRVRVADFGLARAVTDRERPSPAPKAAMLTSPLTTTGCVTGTPRYMAPEQQVGGRIDARADQFAFCITAWEVLFGRHPWNGRVPTRTPPSPPAGVPAALAQTLLRGLAAEPSERHASMDDLLAALPSERAKPSSARAIALGAASATVLTALGIALLGKDDPCSGARQALAGVWDTDRKEHVRMAVLGSELPYAEATWNHLERELDAYVDGWVETHTRTCEATQLQHAQTAEMMDAKMACLAQRRRALAAFLEVVAEGTPGAIEEASLGAIELPRVASCAEDDFVREGWGAPSAEQAEEVDALRDVLAESEALRRAGEYARARALLEDVKPRVEALAFPPVEHEYALERAQVANDLDDWQVEDEALLEAYMGAARSGRASLAAEAASRLALSLADVGQHVEAKRWMTVADSAAPDSPDAELAADLAWRRAGVAIARDDLEVAERAYAEAVTILEAAVGPESPRLVSKLRTHAMALHTLGRFDEARARLDRALELSKTLGARHPSTAEVLIEYARLAVAEEDYVSAETHARQALAIKRATYGDASPDVARVRVLLSRAVLDLGRTSEALELVAEAEAFYAAADLPELGQDHAFALDAQYDALAAAGRIDEAAAKMERALELHRSVLPPTHLEVGHALHNLALARRRQGRLDEALVLDEQAKDVLVASLGPDHPDTGIVVGSIGQTLVHEKRYAEARAALGRQLDIMTRTFGPDALQRAQPLYSIGKCEEALGDVAAAERSYRASLELIERHGAPNDPTLAYPLIRLAAIALDAGRPAEALADAERALALQVDGEALLRADAKAEVAKALWASGQDMARARSFADEAVKAYRELGKGADTQREQLERWRERHGL